MTPAGKVRPPSWWRTLRIAWRYGGRTERRLGMAFLALGYLIPVPLVLVVFLPYPAFRQATLIVLMTAFSLPLFQSGISDAMYTSRYYRAISEQGWLRPEEKAFIVELARFMESSTANGHFSGAVRRSVAYMTVYFGMYYGAYAYLIVAYPLLQESTFLVFAAVYVPLALSCWLLYRDRSKRLLSEASSKGFRLAELRREMRVHRGFVGHRRD